jgi:hypothetical protein
MKPDTEYRVRVRIDNQVKTSMGSIAVISVQNLEDQVDHWKKRALRAEKLLRKSQPELIAELTEAQRRRDEWRQMYEDLKNCGEPDNIGSTSFKNFRAGWVEAKRLQRIISRRSIENVLPD